MEVLFGEGPEKILKYEGCQKLKELTVILIG